jgi:hypothetical protein
MRVNYVRKRWGLIFRLNMGRLRAIVDGAVGVLLFAASGTAASADFRCKVDVGYKWVKSPVTAPDATPAATTPSPGPESQVRFAFLEKTGPDEKTARDALIVEANRAKAKASEACRRDHENMAGCLATKFTIQGAMLGRLSFSAQKRLEDAIEEDCRSQVGTCASVSSSEPVCEQVGQAEPTPAAPEEAGKGDKKGKEKKK